MSFPCCSQRSPCHQTSGNRWCSATQPYPCWIPRLRCCRLRCRAHSSSYRCSRDRHRFCLRLCRGRRQRGVAMTRAEATSDAVRTAFEFPLLEPSPLLFPCPDPASAEPAPLLSRALLFPPRALSAFPGPLPPRPLPLSLLPDFPSPEPADELPSAPRPLPWPWEFPPALLFPALAPGLPAPALPPPGPPEGPPLGPPRPGLPLSPP